MAYTTIIILNTNTNKKSHNTYIYIYVYFATSKAEELSSIIYDKSNNFYTFIIC